MRIFSVSWMLFALSMILASCIQGGGGEGGDEGGFQMPPTATIVEPVQMVDYAPAIELVGEVRATQRATLSAEVPGRIVRIAHRVGEAHARNAGALVQINTADYDAAVAQANAGLTQAEEGLRLARSGPREQEIAAQQAQVNAAKAQYDLALDNLRRQEELYDAGVTPESAIIAARTQADAAEAMWDAQCEVLASLQEGTRDEQIASAEAAVEMTRSMLRQAELARGKTAIAPAFDAVVVDMLVEVGSYVAPGMPVAEVVADGAVEAWFNLPEPDITRMLPGDAVELRLDALPGEVIAGTVISVSAAADEKTRQFPVRVALDDTRALPGMVVHGRLLTAEPVPTLMVKRDAVVLINLGEVVYTMQPPAPDAVPFMEGMPPLPTVQMVLVTTGDTLGDLVAVEGDLAPGMMVVTRGNESLMAGAGIIPTNLMGEGMGAPPGESAPPVDAPADDEAEAEVPAGDGEGQQ